VAAAGGSGGIFGTSEAHQLASPGVTTGSAGGTEPNAPGDELARLGESAGARSAGAANGMMLDRRQMSGLRDARRSSISVFSAAVSGAAV